MKYSMLLNLNGELKNKLEQIARELHMSKTQAIRHLILSYGKE